MTRVALLIGVSQYQEAQTQGASLPPLSTAERDVAAIAKVLQDPYKGNFEEADVQQLINPDLQTIRFGIETLLRDRTQDDLVVLYFSGHALVDETGLLYFATRNTDRSNLSSTAVSADFLQALLYTSIAKKQVIILDCYYSGGIGEVDVKQQLGGYGKAVLSASISFVSLGDRVPDLSQDISAFEYSAKQRSTGLSIYTHYLVEGLETGAADRNNDGAISLDELHEYATVRVQIASPAIQPAIYALPKVGQIQLAKTAIATPKLVYRQSFENFVQRRGGNVSLLSYRTLDIRRDRLGLHPTEALDIQDSVLRPYREYNAKLELYKQVVKSVVQLETLPLSPETQQDLQYLHHDVLGLTDFDIAAIEQPILPPSLEKSFGTLMIGGVTLTLTLVAGIVSLMWYITTPDPPPLPLNWLPKIEGLPKFVSIPFPKPKPKPQPQPERSPQPAPPRPPAVPFRLRTRDPITLFGHAEPVQGLAINPLSSLLISGSWDKTIKIWDLQTGAALQTLTEPGDVVRDIAIAPTGERFASAIDNGTIQIWQLDGQRAKEIASLERTLGDRTSPVYAIAFTSNGETLASGTGDGTIEIWNVDRGKLRKTLTGHFGPVRAVAIAPDDNTLVSGSGDSTIKIWNLNTGQLKNTLTSHTDLVRALAIAPDGNTLVSASWDQTIKIWNLNTGQLKNTLTGHTNLLTAIAISPDGKTLVSGSDDNTIKIWNLDTGEELATLTDHLSDVFSVVISPDGRTLVSASWDTTIKLWR